MGRPPARELTERELEVMHVFWKREGDAGVAEVRDELASAGLDRAYTTIATQVKILADKGYLVQTATERPFRYRASQSYEEVSGRLLSDVVERVFRGSREQLLVRLFARKRLTAQEQAALRKVLGDVKKEAPR